MKNFFLLTSNRIDIPSIYQVRRRINVSKILQYLIAPTPTSPSLSLFPPIQNLPISTQNSTLTNLTQTFLFPTAALNQEIHEKREEENEDTYGMKPAKEKKSKKIMAMSEKIEIL